MISFSGSEYSAPEQHPVAKGFDDMMHQCQWISRNELRQLQNAALANIITHAWSTAPFYRDRLAPLIGPGGAVNLANWHEVPFLSRQDIQENFDLMKSGNCPQAHGEIREARSSGSTAEPVKVLTTQFADVAGVVGGARGQAWANLDFDLNMAQITPTPTGASPYPGTLHDISWAPFWYEKKGRGTLFRLDHVTDHKLQLKSLADCGRCYLNTMPTNLRQLAMMVSNNQELKPDLAAVITVGELVSDELRDFVREHLDCEIFETYSCEEFGGMGWSCPEGHGLHVPDELLLIEVINEQGQSCNPGETGSIVVTSFYNYAMPLIRYRLGDLATVGGLCGCGRGLTLLSRIEGRQRQVFHLPGGVTIMPGLSTGLFAEHLGARKWQVAQIAEDTIEVRFVSGFSKDEQDHSAFEAGANKRFKQQLNYVFKQVDDIPRQPSGKFFEYIRKF